MITRFVTATGTEIGKTFVTAALCHQLRGQGARVRALKPVVTGLGETDLAQSDPGILLRSTGMAMGSSARESLGAPNPHPVPLPQGEGTLAAMLEAISPFRFAAPLAPSMAAAREGRRLSIDEVVTYCARTAQGPEDVLLIEGVGGVMVPLAPGATVLDWMAALGAPAILVAGSYLGSLSHTLTALAALRQARIAIAGLVVSETKGSTVGLEETVAELRAWAEGAPVIGMPFIEGPDPWANAPDLTGLAQFSALAAGSVRMA